MISFEYGDFYDSLEDFWMARLVALLFWLEGGDWDDPTGGFIKVSTYEEELEKITKQLADLKKQFDIED